MAKTLKEFLHEYADEIENVKEYKLRLIKLEKLLTVSESWLSDYSKILEEICEGRLNCPDEELEEWFGSWAEVHKDRKRIKNFIEELQNEIKRKIHST